jgi:hypothetical protein
MEKDRPAQPSPIFCLFFCLFGVFCFVFESQNKLAAAATVASRLPAIAVSAATTTAARSRSPTATPSRLPAIAVSATTRSCSPTASLRPTTASHTPTTASLRPTTATARHAAKVPLRLVLLRQDGVGRVRHGVRRPARKPRGLARVRHPAHTRRPDHSVAVALLEHHLALALHQPALDALLHLGNVLHLRLRHHGAQHLVHIQRRRAVLELVRPALRGDVLGGAPPRDKVGRVEVAAGLALLLALVVIAVGLAPRVALLAQDVVHLRLVQVDEGLRRSQGRHTPRLLRLTRHPHRRVQHRRSRRLLIQHQVAPAQPVKGHLGQQQVVGVKRVAALAVARLDGVVLDVRLLVQHEPGALLLVALPQVPVVVQGKLGGAAAAGKDVLRGHHEVHGLLRQEVARVVERVHLEKCCVLVTCEDVMCGKHLRIEVPATMWSYGIYTSIATFLLAEKKSSIFFGQNRWGNFMPQNYMLDR